MHIVGINFISFTAHNNALHMLGKKGNFWHLGGMAPLAPINPPMNSDTLSFLFFPFFFLSFSSPSSYIFPFFSFFSSFFSSVFLFPSFPLPPFRSKTPWIQGLGERCKLPQWGLGRSPSWNRIWRILTFKMWHLVATNLIIFDIINWSNLLLCL